MLNPVSVREAVHVLILRELATVKSGNAVVLKGGVNLRLFFGSLRYSEDMDLDGDPSASRAIRSAIKCLFENRDFLIRLRELGVRELDPGQGPNKDTQTTFRYKFGAWMGGVRHSTKIEVSFRERNKADQVAVDAASETVVERYLRPGEKLAVPHYERNSAVRQKVIALADRATVQARDVFDLHVLVPREGDDKLISFLASSIETGKLRTAYDRALEITYSEYQGQVMEFLADDVRERYGSREVWDGLRLSAVALIETAIKNQETAAQA